MTDSTHGHRRYPNLLRGLGLLRSDQAWAADITRIRLPQAFVYLAAILDAFSCHVVGRKLACFIDTEVALAALEHALVTRQ